MAKTKSGSGPRRPAAADSVPAPLGASELPQPASVKEQAEALLQFLDLMGQEGTPDLGRLRSEIIDVIADYADRRERGEDVDALRADTANKFLAVEGQAALVLQRIVRKLQERIAAGSRRIGTGSAEGKSIRTMAEGLGQLTAALGELAAATKGGDDEARERAHATIDRIRAEMEHGLPV